jgi:hypothetical protein
VNSRLEVVSRSRAPQVKETAPVPGEGVRVEWVAVGCDLGRPAAGSPTPWNSLLFPCWDAAAAECAGAACSTPTRGVAAVALQCAALQRHDVTSGVGSVDHHQVAGGAVVGVPEGECNFAAATSLQAVRAHGTQHCLEAHK